MVKSIKLLFQKLSYRLYGEKRGITMTIKHIAKILSKHGINFTITGNRIMVEDDYTINGILHTDILDMTGISPEQLYDWLGY